MKKCIVVILLLMTAATVFGQTEKDFLETTAKTRDVATPYFEAYIAMNWDQLEPMLHPDASFEDPTANLLFGGKLHQGKANVVKNFREGYASLTSMKANTTRSFVSGNTAVFEMSLVFGFRNRQQGITTITMPLVVVVTVKDGKVFAHRDYGDYREYLTQVKAAIERSTQKN